MGTDYKAMLESTSNHQPTISSPTCTALLCCPFCGGGDMQVGVGWRAGSDAAYVHCRGCGGHMSRSKGRQGAAIKAWNLRAT